MLFLRRYRSRGIPAAENIAKDGDAPTTNGQITVVIEAANVKDNGFIGHVTYYKRH